MTEAGNYSMDDLPQALLAAIHMARGMGEAGGVAITSLHASDDKCSIIVCGSKHSREIADTMITLVEKILDPLLTHCEKTRKDEYPDVRRN